jgi:pimeloyl-ACP methyl ester carboxylesterase
VAIAPDSSRWKEAFGKMMDLAKKPFDLGDEKVKNIKAKTLLIAGDNDGMDKAVLIDTYKLLGGCQVADMSGLPKNQLAILPGHSHVSLMLDNTRLLALITPFLSN